MEEWDRVVSASHSGLLRRLSEQGTCFVFSNFYGVGISDKGQAPHSAATVYIEMEILHPLRLVQGNRLRVPQRWTMHQALSGGKLARKTSDLHTTVHMTGHRSPSGRDVLATSPSVA